MQSRGFSLPELHHVGDDFVASPMVGAGDRLPSVPFIQLLDCSLEFQIVRNDIRLRGSDGSKLAHARSRTKVTVRNRFRSFDGPALNSHLSIQHWPVEVKCNVRLAGNLASFCRIIVREKQESVWVNMFKQYDSTACASIGISGRQRHRIDFEPLWKSTIPQLREPILEKRHRFFWQFAPMKRSVSVISPQILNGQILSFRLALYLLTVNNLVVIVAIVSLRVITSERLSKFTQVAFRLRLRS